VFPQEACLPNNKLECSQGRTQEHPGHDISQKICRPIFIAALALNHCLATGTNATYDVSRDFSETNPGTPWSYGSMETLGGDFTPFPALLHEKEPGGGTFTIWVKVGGGYPSVYYNGSSATIITEQGQGVYPPGTVLLLPGMEGNHDNYGVIRFTLPNPNRGTYLLRSMVQSYLQGPTSHDCDFHILKNGVELFGKFLPPNGGTSYSNTVALAAGDTIDFVVGRGQDNRLFASGLRIRQL